MFNNKLFNYAIIAAMHEQMIRLYEAAEKLKKTAGQTDVARLINVSPQVINNWEKRGISRDGIKFASKTIGCNPTWLDSNEGSMTGDTICVEDFALPTQVKPGYVRFPLVDAPHGMGGHLAPTDNPDILQYVEVNEDWARRALNANFAHIKIVPSIGDSMSGTIEDGSVVFVDTNTKHFTGDGLYSIVWQGRLQIKRLQARHEEKRLRIISDNKLYDPDWATDDLIISGRVLAAWNFRRF